MAGETRSDRFQRLAQRRTEVVLDAIRKLANLSNAYAYDYSPEQIAYIFDTIHSRLDLARQRFEAELKFSGSGDESFTLLVR